MFDKIKLKNIFNTNDLLKIINELEKNIVEVSDKQNFLDYIEFELIFNELNHNELLSEYESGLMKSVYISRKNLLKQLKNWINKKRELIKIVELKQSKIITNFKTNITQTETSIFPFLTQHGKNLFEEYLKTSTDYNDISFIFYQLTESDPPEMFNMKYNEYIDWLKKNKHITEKEFNNLEKKISLNKKSNAQFRKDRLTEIKSRLKKAE